MKSVMSHQFSQAPQAEIPRSSFDRSHGLKTTFQAGQLVPILVDEVLPGDTFNVNMTGFARMATPIFPVMENLFMETFFFAIPYRLVWDNWQKFNGEQRNPGESTDFLIPTITSPVGGYANSSLHDYLGIPPLVPGLEHSALWHRAYNLVFNQWFRDQNIQTSRGTPTDDGPDDPALYVVESRGKRHDYFTSALPWPQKGDSVSLPLGTTAPVIGIGIEENQTFGLAGTNVRETGGDVRQYAFSENLDSAFNFYMEGDAAGAGGAPLIFADLASATAATINQLRQAFQVQKIFERDARGGTRYTEIIKAHFGVSSADERLQRPEFLGGGSSPINVVPVPQTSNTEAIPTTPQGNLAGYATATLSNHGFTKSFTEHCLILGLISVRADITYQQGLPRMFSRQTRFDFYWPALAHIGEQAILNKEIFAQGTDNPTDDAAVFGYQERFAEYRYFPSQISGVFRSNDPLTLDSWHLSQDFASLPTLNGSFIVENPPMARVLAVATGPNFLFDAYFSMRCARPMPLYGVPGMIDHF